MLTFSLKESRQANPLQVPQRGPYGEECPLTGHFSLSHHFFFNLSLRIPGKGAPSTFPAGSQWAAILRPPSHWSTFH